MNERIKLLAEQAGLYDEKTPEEVPQFTACFEKFADLILNEHLNVMRQRWYEVNNAAPVENETPRDVGLRVGRKSEIIFLMEELKKHFGA